jgi:hypothetical protein
MATKNLAVLMLLPATQLNGGHSSRVIRGVIPGIQYFMNNRAWMQAGLGTGLRTPTLFDWIRGMNLAPTIFIGPSAYFSFGYDIRLSKTVTIDIEGRFQYARFNQTGSPFSEDVFTGGLLLGFTIY